MRKLVIFAAGTSVLRGLEKHGVTLPSQATIGRLTDSVIAGLDDRVSAEISTVAALGVTEDDQVVLLATDTGAGALAAEINARILERGCLTEVRRVAGLSLDNPDQFRREGLSKLVTELDRAIADALSDGAEVMVSVGTGLKVLTPYLALYGLLRGTGLCYMFEHSNVLVKLPRLPVAFDYELLARASRVIVEINARSEIPEAELRGRLGTDFERLEGLFDETRPGWFTLSPFGFLVMGDLENAAAGTIMLSPSARSALANAEGVAKQQLAFMIARGLDPLWRQVKRHKQFVGSDLDVFKPGRTGQRMAGWLGTENTLYVAELYADHDTYERELPGRRRTDYPRESFEPWEPPFRDAVTDEEREGERLLRVVEQREREFRDALSTAQRDAEDALVLAARTEADARDAEQRWQDVQRGLQQELDALRARAAALETELMDRTAGSWPIRIWRALRRR